MAASPLPKNANINLFNRLSQKYIRLEITNKDLEYELEQIEYPREYSNKIYKLICEAKDSQTMRLNRKLIVNSKVFQNKMQLLSIFGEFDENNDGFISMEEFGKALTNQGFSSDDSKKMFEKFDEDGNGNISFDEFVQAFEEHWGPNMQNMDDTNEDDDIQSEVYTTNNNDERKNNNDNIDNNGINNINNVNTRFKNGSTSSIITDNEITDLLSKIDLNSMKNIDDSTKEILISLTETVNNLMKERSNLNDKLEDWKSIRDSLTIEIDTYKIENQRLIAQNELLTEQVGELNDNLKSLETPRMPLKLGNVFSETLSEIGNNNNTNNNKNRTFSEESTNTTILIDKSGIDNNNDSKKDSNNNNQKDSVASVDEAGAYLQINNKGKHGRNVSLLNDRQITMLNEAITKKNNELESLNNEIRLKENELLKISNDIGTINKLENENKELRGNINKLETKFEKEIEKYQTKLASMKNENRKISEWTEKLENDLNEQKELHNQEITRMSIAMQEKDDASFQQKVAHSRTDTTLRIKGRMKSVLPGGTGTGAALGVGGGGGGGDMDMANSLQEMFGGGDMNDANALVVELENEIEEVKYENDQLREKVQALEQDLERKETKINEIENENAKLKIEKMQIDDSNVNNNNNNDNNNSGGSLFDCLCCGLTNSQPKKDELQQRLIE